MPAPSTPRLSIGMPVYNGEAYVEGAIAAILAQTFADFELIVCDNGSTDRTQSIVAGLARQDDRIRYVRNDRNIGANANFSKVATLARAPYFKWAAHDDLHAPTYLEKCIALLEADPGLVLAHADSVFIDGAGAPFRAGQTCREWIEPGSGDRYIADPVDLGQAPSAVGRFRQVIFASLWGTHMFGVIRRSALARTDLVQDVPSSDRPLLAELALLGRFATVREPLYSKRFHARMTTGLTDAEIRRYVSADNAAYGKRRRQLSVFLSTPSGKPIGWLGRAACRGLVLLMGSRLSSGRLAASSTRPFGRSRQKQRRASHRGNGKANVAEAGRQAG